MNTFQTLYNQFNDQLSSLNTLSIRDILNLLEPDNYSIHPIKTTFRQILTHPETVLNTHFLLNPQNNSLATKIIIIHLLELSQK